VCRLPVCDAGVRRRRGVWVMLQRVFVSAAIACTALLGVAIFLLVASHCNLDPRQHSVSITGDCHVTVANGYIEFFNDAEYGPYRGSIVAILDDQGNSHPPIERTGFGETWGVYYRHLRWLDSGDVIWTVAISLVYPLVLFSILPVTWGWCRWRHTHRLRKDSSPGAQP